MVYNDYVVISKKAINLSKKNTRRINHVTTIQQLYIFRVSTTPIIRSIQNCNYSLQYWSYFLCSYLPPWPGLATLEGGS